MFCFVLFFSCLDARRNCTKSCIEIFKKMTISYVDLKYYQGLQRRHNAHFITLPLSLSVKLVRFPNWYPVQL